MGEVVTAFVVPTESAIPSDELAEEISTDVKQRLSKHEYPRRIEFVDKLPKTASERPSDTNSRRSTGRGLTARLRPGPIDGDCGE